MTMTADRNLRGGFGFIVLGIMALAAVLPQPHASATQAGDKTLTPSMTVVGSGIVSAKPDMAQIQVGIVTEAPNAGKALDDNNQAMDKLFKAMDARGIAKKDVQTSSFNVMPVYKPVKPGGPQSQITGYRVSNMVRIKVRKLDMLGQVLDELVQKGANQVHGISFSVAETAPLLDEARRKAMADARRKAELYAKEAGVEVGQVLLIQEQTPRLPVSPVMAFDRLEAAGAAVPVAEGELDFGANITVTYALTNKGGGTGKR